MSSHDPFGAGSEGGTGSGSDARETRKVGGDPRDPDPRDMGKFDESLDGSSSSDPRDESHPATWQIKFVRWLPLHLVATPERVILNVAFLFVGLAAIISQDPTSVLARLPAWMLLSFSVGMGAGGFLVLYGLFRRKRSAERLGYLMVLFACCIYAPTVVAVRGWAGVPIGIVFVGFAIMKVIRLLISSAEREMVVEIGRRQRDRERHAKERDAARGDR